MLTGFEPIIAKNVQKINFKFTMISIFTTLLPTFLLKLILFLNEMIQFEMAGNYGICSH